MNHIDIKHELQTEHDQEEKLVEESIKQEKATQSSTLRGCIRCLAGFEKAKVDPAFIAVARPYTKIAVGLALGADRNMEADEILAMLWLSWTEASATHDAKKGTLAAWTQSVFSNKIKQIRSNLCLTGQGTTELNKPIGDGDATGMDLLVATTADELPEVTRPLPELKFSPLASMALDGLTCSEIAEQTGENVRKVQRAIKNDVERVVKKRIADMKFAGQTVEQIVQQLGGTLTAGSGEIAPPVFYQQPEFGGRQPSKRPVKAAPAKASKPPRSSISLDFIQDVSPQSSLFDMLEMEGV